MKENISMAFQDFSQQFIQGLSEIHRSLDLKETKDAVVRVASQVFGAKGASLLLFDRTHDAMKLSAAYGLSEAYKLKGDVNPKKSLGETTHGNVVVIRDVATDPNLQYPQEALKEGIKSIVGIPVAVGNILVGTLRLYFDSIRDISWEEMEYLKMLALHVGLSLRKSFYFESIKTSTTNIHLVPPFKISESMSNLVKSATLSGNSKGCSLFLIKQSDGMLERVASFGLSDNYLSQGKAVCHQEHRRGDNGKAGCHIKGCNRSPCSVPRAGPSGEHQGHHRFSRDGGFKNCRCASLVLRF